MTITLNSDYDVTLNTALLGYVGETNARPVSVEGMEIDGADRYVLTIDYGDGVQYEVDITGGQWTPTADILRSAQTISCQICAKKLSGDEYILVKKSRIFRLRIGAAIGNNAVPSPDVAVDALDRIDAIGRQAHADMQTAVTAADTATTMANNAAKSATAAEKSADTAEQAAERAETAQASAETSTTQAETAMQGAETARAEAVTSQNNAKISAAQAATSAQQTEADKTITAGYAKTAKTNADSTTADKQAVQEMATQVTADKATVEDHAAQVATDRTAAETAAQTAQSVADSLPEDYVTAVGKIAENTTDIGRVKLTDKELQRRVNALFDMGNGITHRFETDSDTAYQKAVPTGAKLMSVKSVGGRSIVWNQLVKTNTDFSNTITDTRTFFMLKLMTFDSNGTVKEQKILIWNSNEIKSVKNSFIFKITADGNTVSIRHNGEKKDIRIYENATTQTIANHTYYLSINIKSADPSTVGGLQCNNLMLIDLTQMFGSGNEPTSVEEFGKMFPADYYPYNAGEIVSSGTEEVVEQGANLYYGTDMLKCGSDDYEYIANSYRCKTIKLKPKTAYTLSFTSDKTSEIILLMNVNTVVNSQPYLDFRKTSDNRSYRTGDDGCLYVGVYAGNGAVASADVVKRLSECEIMISEGDTPTAYAPYHRTTYPIPEAIKALPGYGWSAGTVRNYVDYENKQYHQCVGSVDLGTVNWNIDNGIRWYTYVLPKYLTDKNAMCNKLIYSSNIESNDESKWINSGAGFFEIFVANVTTSDDVAEKMSGVILYYELESPIVTDISTLIPDDFLRNIEVESGGSVTFKNSNDSYRIPVPNEEEYVVKLSEVGGTT